MTATKVAPVATHRARKPPPARRPGSRVRDAKLLHFGAFGLPSLALYAGFVLIPIGMAAAYSLTNRNLLNPPTRWVGLHNYATLVQDSAFWRVLLNTFVITVIVTVGANAIGLAVAVMLDRRGWLYNTLRSVYFVPVVLSGVVVSVIWQAILTDDGLLNATLRRLGVEHPPGWLSDPSIALYTLSGIVTWQMVGFCVVVYLAGLQAVPSELQEAAAVDGAGPVQRFCSITWPLLAPSLTINTVMLLISTFKIYDHVQVITNGGPGDGTTSTIAFDVIQTGLAGNRSGYASAVAVVMLVVVACASILVLNVLQRRELSA
ncbi:carbohydrate ABC transporter permease [Actinoplanes sp. CA-030573]|uniref:carbohydrate ABC transporter permease n=1 Tax=Actinoplanes sp. CA-030573 TaxID=3239898 RepID=UPI003D8B700D